MGGHMLKSEKACMDSTDRVVSAGTPEAALSKQWLQPKQTNPWVVDTQNKTHQVGIKYLGRDNAKHLQQVLEQQYEITTDWVETKYVGLTLDWDYNNKQVNLSMPGFVQNALKRFNHHAKENATPTIPPCLSKLWRKNPICTFRRQCQF